MISNAYALFDTKGGFFGPPFFCQSHGEAIRVCIDAAQDMRSTIARYPSDFILHHIGTYDNTTGQMAPCLPDSIGLVSAMLPRQQPLPLENLAQASIPETLNGAANNG